MNPSSNRHASSSTHAHGASGGRGRHLGLGFALAVAGSLSSGCRSDNLPLDVVPGGLWSWESSQRLMVTVTSKPGARVTCKPDCGDMPVGEDGTVVVDVGLEERAGAQRIEISVKDGLFIGATKSTSFEYVHRPNLSVRDGADDSKPATLRCFIATCSGKVDWSTGAVELVAPTATRIELGSFVDASRTDQPHHFNLSSAIGAHPLSLLETSSGRARVELPLRITFEDGAVLEQKLQTTLLLGEILGAFRGVGKEPLVFGDEPARPAGPTSAFILDESGSPKILGNPALFRDVDVVAVRTFVDRKLSCGAYVSQTGETRKLDLELRDMDVTALDRRTGKVLSKKRFAAPGCPDSYDSYRPTGDDHHTNAADSEAVATWVQSLLKPSAQPKKT